MLQTSRGEVHLSSQLLRVLPALALALLVLLLLLLLLHRNPPHHPRKTVAKFKAFKIVCSEGPERYRVDSYNLDLSP